MRNDMLLLELEGDGASEFTIPVDGVSQIGSAVSAILRSVSDTAAPGATWELHLAAADRGSLRLGFVMKVTNDQSYENVRVALSTFNSAVDAMGNVAKLAMYAGVALHFLAPNFEPVSVRDLPEPQVQQVEIIIQNPQSAAGFESLLGTVRRLGAVNVVIRAQDVPACTLTDIGSSHVSVIGADAEAFPEAGPISGVFDVTRTEGVTKITGEDYSEDLYSGLLDYKGEKVPVVFFWRSRKKEVPGVGATVLVRATFSPNYLSDQFNAKTGIPRNMRKAVGVVEVRSQLSEE